ncbi:MAG: hypothetical protein ACI9H1_001362 [Polaribacter sp.]|jgi:hypothetical protein|tara:strand:+ start:235 stop:942 length:708 start_codon:yes stop_codon:yes gene_type:complete
MKIKFQCSKCFLENINTYDFVQVRDEDLYEYKCSRGHVNLYFVKNEKFELLMESALYAIQDGYYREAISSLTSSLERLQEFLIKVLFRKYNTSERVFDTAWKKVSQQSERQLGAFIFLYVKEYRELPDNLTDNERKFRNSVIHKGRFPTYEETLKYGQRILDITYSNLKKIRESLEHIIREMSEEKQQSILNKFNELDASPFSHLSKTSINIYHDVSSFKKTNLVEYLDLIKKLK